MYRLTSTFTVAGHPHRIMSIDVCPAGDNLAITTENAQAFVLKSFNSEVLKAEDMVFEPLVELFHTGPISGLDVCVRKPIVVTCGSQDKSVRYVTLKP